MTFRYINHNELFSHGHGRDFPMVVVEAVVIVVLGIDRSKGCIQGMHWDGPQEPQPPTPWNDPIMLHI